MCFSGLSHMWYLQNPRAFLLFCVIVIISTDIGDRLRCAREIDRSVKGAKEARQELKEARRRALKVEEDTHRREMMKQIQTSFYKSPVGTRLN